VLCCIPASGIGNKWNLKFREISMGVDCQVVCDRRENYDRSQEDKSEESEEYVKGSTAIHE